MAKSGGKTSPPVAPPGGATPHDAGSFAAGLASRRPLAADDALAVRDRGVDLRLDVLNELLERDLALEGGLEVLLPARREGLLPDVRVELQDEVALRKLALQDLLHLLLERRFLRHLRVERLESGHAPPALRPVLRGFAAHVLLEHRPGRVGVLGLRGDDPTSRGHRRVAAHARPGRRGKKNGLALGLVALGHRAVPVAVLEDRDLALVEVGAHPVRAGIDRRLVHTIGGEVVEIAEDRKSTRLNSSHSSISYAVLCLRKKLTEYFRERRSA